MKKGLPVRIYETEAMEQWLSRMAEEGWRLKEFSAFFGGSATFETAVPAHCAYCLTLQTRRNWTVEEVQNAYLEDGWTYVCVISGEFWVYVSENPDAARPQIVV